MKQYEIQVNGKVYHVSVKELPEQTDLTPTTSQEISEKPAPSFSRSDTEAESSASMKVTAPMPGTILSLAIKKGQAVEAGEVLCILEAMKMENEIVAPQSGIVSSISVHENQIVEAGDTLVVF
ncbi:biotin/lipoyl-containing protein [Carnobacterium mobile]|uniref:biotin/lipoyl-containing protein n=1 Tax=Carnobacterium mobile TaxID=2750 RepID=UPI00054EF940|nr:biotin/lipoyl-containing protein [Carnobacterium mobile]